MGHFSPHRPLLSLFGLYVDSKCQILPGSGRLLHRKWNPEFLRLIYIGIKGISLIDNLVEMYEKVKIKNAKFGVGKSFGTAGYFVVDVDLAKQILVKDFDHFVDRRSFGTGNSNKVFGKMLLLLEGDKWKALRSKMSPTFTTGKIRRMFQILNKSGQSMVKYLEDEVKQSPDGVLDMQEAYSKYTMDVIASAAFGIESKAFDQRDPSLFEQMASKMQIKLNFVGILKFLVMMISPKLADKLGIEFMEVGPQEFFSKVIKSAIKYREDKMETEKRDDFLQLLLETRAGKLKGDEGQEQLSQYEKEALIVSKGQEEVGGSKVTVELEDDDIVAQCVLFIFAGYDTVQSLLLFGAYNLAVYPDVQERLYQEVKKSVEDNDGKMTYDSVNQMEFMEMYISETLRHYPPNIALERQCTRAYKIPDTNIVVKKGEIVTFPIYAIQRDADHFIEPYKFDPERFSAENRSKIPPCAYMPFGYGPRNCIAMRLALVEAKMAIAYLVLNFEFEPSAKTLIPVKFSTSGSLKPAGGTWLKVKSRK